MATDLKETSVPLAEISQGPNAFEAFLDRNQKGIVVLAILLTLGAATLVVYRGVQSSGEESAGAALVKANDLAGLKAIVDDHAGSRAAGSASVLLAEKQWTAGNQDAAIATLRGFISSGQDHPAIHTAKANLASKLMVQGKSDEASRLFQEIASDPTARYLAPFALVSLGDIARNAGDASGARTFYERANTEFPQSNFASTATRRMILLDAKPPVEIEPPPAPVTPPDAGTAPAPTITPAPAVSPSPTPPPAPLEEEVVPQEEPAEPGIDTPAEVPPAGPEEP